MSANGLKLQCKKAKGHCYFIYSLRDMWFEEKYRKGVAWIDVYNSWSKALLQRLFVYNKL